MIIGEELYLEHQVNLFLDHHGVKGMHWGIRNDPKWDSRKETAKKVASKSVKVAKVVGRGSKKTYEFAKTHPRTTGAAVALIGFHFIMGHSSINVKYKVVRTAAIAYAGARFAQWRFDKDGSKKWSELNL